MGFLSSAAPALQGISAGAQLAGGLGASSALKAGAAQQERLGAFNYEAEIANAETTNLLTLAGIGQTQVTQEAQAELLHAQTELDFWAAKANARRMRYNARRIRAYGRLESKLAKENKRRVAASHEKFKSTQRATIAASGVVMNTGSPLHILIETAGDMKQQLNDLDLEQRIRRTQRREAAAFEQFNARMTLLGARNSRAVGHAAADLVVEPTGLRTAAADAQLDASTRGAEINLLGTQSSAAGMRSQGDAAIIGGAGAAAGGLLRAVA